MNSISRESGIFFKVCLILVYVSFYLVQLSVYGAPAVQPSVFTGENGGRHVSKDLGTVSKDSRKESKPACFRLNKRFQPEYFFTAPGGLNDLAKFSFSIQTILLNETQPLTDFSFNSPSLRGPPAVV